MLAARGRVANREDVRVLRSCAAEIVAGISSRRLEEQDAEAAWHVADLRSRTALLAATGESAREQLAAAHTALTTLEASEDHRTALTAEDRAQLLAEAARAVEQVSRVVDDLADLGRLHAGEVETYLCPVDLDEVLATCLDDLGPGRQEVTLSLAEDLPDVIADGWVEVRITDQGPDERAGAASLALRLASDLAEAMGVALRCERTASGGRTVVIILPAAAGPPTRAKYSDDDAIQLT